MKEIWKTVVEASNYEVSNLGRIRNITTGKYLNPSKHKSTINRIKLRNNSEKLSSYVLTHLILKAFGVKNPKRFKNVLHINGDKKDNRLDNLEWGTHRTNARPKELILAIRKEIEKGTKTKAIMEKFDLPDYKTVWEIKNFVTYPEYV